MSLVLPTDVLVAAAAEEGAAAQQVHVASIPDDLIGLDIGTTTIQSIAKVPHAHDARARESGGELTRAARRSWRSARRSCGTGRWGCLS